MPAWTEIKYDVTAADLSTRLGQVFGPHTDALTGAIVWYFQVGPAVAHPMQSITRAWLLLTAPCSPR